MMSGVSANHQSMTQVREDALQSAFSYLQTSMCQMHWEYCMGLGAQRSMGGLEDAVHLNLEQFVRIVVTRGLEGMRSDVEIVEGAEPADDDAADVRC